MAYKKNYNKEEYTKHRRLKFFSIKSKRKYSEID